MQSKLRMPYKWVTEKCDGIHGLGAVCVYSEKEAVGRASTHYLLAGLMRVARTCRKMAQATPS